MELDTCAIVVAHPDDEILWFGSLVAKVGRIVICYGPSARFPERGAQRRRVIDAYPLATPLTCFDLFQPPNEDPAWTPKREADHRRDMAAKLEAALTGCTTVLTHNSWGEYGHFDHLRVHAVVNGLQPRMNLRVLTSCYVEFGRAEHARAALADVTPEVLSFPVDKAPLAPIVALYQRHGCWTWYDDWTWPALDHFLDFGQAGPRRAGSVPLNVFRMG
jgi:LmbE family N-acetylglucosaminyl deacetylase